jgi:hypothetical protein
VGRMRREVKSCKVCEHVDRAVIERGLGVGQSPRSIKRRYASLSRKAIERHRDVCLLLGPEGGTA